MEVNSQPTVPAGLYLRKKAVIGAKGVAGGMRSWCEGFFGRGRGTGGRQVEENTVEAAYYDHFGTCAF